MEDLYAGLAERYDLAKGPMEQDDSQMAEFFSKMFLDHKVLSVLDCACGTGQHLAMLNNLGVDVSGSDVSPSMLEQAQKNLTKFDLAIPLLQADFRSLPYYFNDQFDAVLCLAAIGYMPNEEELLRAFRSMRAILRNEGILILTSMPTDKQWREKTRFILASSTISVSRLFVVDYSDRTARFNVLDIFHSGSENELKVWITDLSVFLKADLEKLLLKAGFQSVDFYESFDFKPYNPGNSDQLIAVATT